MRPRLSATGRPDSTARSIGVWALAGFAGTPFIVVVQVWAPFVEDGWWHDLLTGAGTSVMDPFLILVVYGWWWWGLPTYAIGTAGGILAGVTARVLAPRVSRLRYELTCGVIVVSAYLAVIAIFGALGRPMLDTSCWVYVVVFGIGATVSLAAALVDRPFARPPPAVPEGPTPDLR